MIRLTQAQVQPIGLDIGHDSVKMLQLAVGRESISVVAACMRPFPDEVRDQPQLRLPTAVQMIRQMLRDEPFRGRSVVTAVPSNLLHVKNCRLPLMPANELESALALEVNQLFSFNGAPAIVQHILAGEVRQGNETRQELVVLAALSSDLTEFLEQMHCAGVVVQSLDAEPCAVFRSVERNIRRRQDEQEVHVVADVGLRRTQVVIGKGRQISFYKPVEIGSDHLNQAVSGKLQISIAEARELRRRLRDTSSEAGDQRHESVRQAVVDATRGTMEELAREIVLCLRYHSVTFRGQRPVRVRLSGGEAQDSLLRQVLQGGLGVPVELHRPLARVDTSCMGSERRGSHSEWAVALGLGLKMAAVPTATATPIAADSPEPQETEAAEPEVARA